MAQACTMVAILLVALLAIAPQQAAAGLGLGKGKGKGGDVAVDVQCTQSCKNVCATVPNKICNEVPYQTQVCQKVPVQENKQHCERVCTNTYQEIVTTGKGKGMLMSYGKGKGYGRHLLGLPAPLLKSKGKNFVPKYSGKDKGYYAAPMGKGKGALVDTNCQDVCHDIPYTAYTTQCDSVTKTKTMCDIVYQQQCDQVCKPVCQKTTTVITTQVVSSGKGKGVPVTPMYGKGKGKDGLFGKH